MKAEERAYYKKRFHADIDRDKLEHAGKISINDNKLDWLALITANYLYDQEEDFAAPKPRNPRKPVPLVIDGRTVAFMRPNPRKVEKFTRQWFVREIEKVWRDCGGTGTVGYYKDNAGQHTGPLLDLLIELLNQFGVPDAQRRRRAFYRILKPEKNRRD